MTEQQQQLGIGAVVIIIIVLVVMSSRRSAPTGGGSINFNSVPITDPLAALESQEEITKLQIRSGEFDSFLNYQLALKSIDAGTLENQLNAASAQTLLQLQYAGEVQLAGIDATTQATIAHEQSQTAQAIANLQATIQGQQLSAAAAQQAAQMAFYQQQSNLQAQIERERIAAAQRAAAEAARAQRTSSWLSLLGNTIPSIFQGIFGNSNSNNSGGWSGGIGGIGGSGNWGWSW